MSTSDVFDYIATVELAQRMSNQSERNAPRASAYVNAGAIQIFHESLPDQQREDALHWILFGQLAADKAAEKDGYTRTSDPEKWYHSFIGFLTRIGMQSTERERHQADPYQLKETVAETALHLLKPFLKDEHRALAVQALRNLQQDACRDALQVLNKRASGNEGGHLLLLGASVDAYLNLIIHLTSLDFQAKQPVKDVLSHEKGQIANLFYGKDTLILGKTLADRLRATIGKRLENVGRGLIVPIKES